MSIDIDLKVQDKVNGPIRYEAYNVLREKLLNGDKTFDYKGFTLQILGNKSLGYYCGYIKSIPKDIVKVDLDNLSSMDIIYQPHGGFTAPDGFDCVHHTDLMVGMIQFNLPDKLRENSSATFKSSLFVESELKNIVDSIINLQTYIL